MSNASLHGCVEISYHRVIWRMCLLVVLLTTKDVINLEITNSRRSDVHAERQYDQSTSDSLTTDEKIALKHELQERFGLPNIPESANVKASLFEHSSHKFLLNVYENNVANDSETRANEELKSSEFDLTKNDLSMIDQSDLIITFKAEKSHRKAGATPDGVTRLWFNVEAVPKKDRMISAKLRLYRGPNAKNRMNRGSFTITAYRVLREKDGETEMRFVDSANTTVGHQGWITLNVTESLRHWMEHPDDNNGLHLSVRPIEGSRHETGFEEIGIVGFEGNEVRQPFIVGFFRNDESGRVGVQPSTLGSLETYNGRNKKRHATRRKINRLCRVKKLYIRFKELGWDEWIIEPQGLNLNYCAGACIEENDETYYVTIKRTVNKMTSRKLPEPCCTPTKLSGVDAIYYISETNVAMKRWNNVSVKACGCM